MTNHLLSVSVLRHYLALNRQLWLRPLIVAIVLLLSAALAFKASALQLLLVLGLIPGLGVMLIFMRWPSLGLILASVAGFVVPYTGPSGLNVTMIMVASLLGLWLVDILVRQREIRLVTSRVIWPLLSFVLLAMLSFGVGQLPWFSFVQHAPMGAQLGGLSIVVLSAGAFLLAAEQMHDLRWLKAMTWVFLAVAAVFIVGSLIPQLRPFTKLLFQSGSFASLSYIWLVALAFSQVVFNRDLHPGWRLALGILTVATFYIVLVLKFEEKGGWIPLLICVAAIIWFRSWRTGLALALIGIVPALYLAPQLLASDEYSVSTRLDALLILIEVVKASPILGLGFANYYWYTPLFPIRGYAVQFNSHNNYVDIVAQTGLLGLACFLWLFWEAGWLGWRLRDRVPTGFAQAYVYGALAGLAGTLVAGMLGDWVLPFFYNIGLVGFRQSVIGWLCLGGLVSLAKMVEQKNIEQENS